MIVHEGNSPPNDITTYVPLPNGIDEKPQRDEKSEEIAKYFHCQNEILLVCVVCVAGVTGIHRTTTGSLGQT